MKKYWDSVEVGHTFKPIKKPPISRGQIAQFAAASNDFSPLNLDDDYAKNAGFTSAFASGLMCLALAEESLKSFAKNMQIISLSGTFQKIIWPGDSLISHGLILRRYQKNGEYRIQFTLWCENQLGEVVMKGTSQCSLFKNNKSESQTNYPLPAVTQLNREALYKKCDRLFQQAEITKNSVKPVLEQA